MSKDWMKEGRFNPSLESMDYQIQRFERREAELKSRQAYHAKKAKFHQEQHNLANRKKEGKSHE